MSNSTRIFSFGLGRSPSRSLVKGVARATNGHFVFIPPDTSVDTYVGDQLEKALQSSITNVQVKWNLQRNIMNAPTITPPVYVNDHLIVYALVHDDNDNQTQIFDHNSSVELYNDKVRLGEAKVNEIPSVNDNGTIARLAAKALILELQHSKLSSSNTKNGSRQARFEEQVQEEREKSLDAEKEERKKRIIELSLKYNILSPYTAFVGIEKRTDGDNAEMELREVPIQIAADDQNLNDSFLTQMNMSSAAYSFPQMYADCFDMDLQDEYPMMMPDCYSIGDVYSSNASCFKTSTNYCMDLGYAIIGNEQDDTNYTTLP